MPRRWLSCVVSTRPVDSGSELERFPGFGKGLAADDRKLHLFKGFLHLARRFILRKALADLILHFVKRLLARVLVFLKLDEVIAELRLDGLGHVAGLKGEGCLFKLGYHAALLEPAEFAALGRAARVFRRFLRYRAEILATLDALGDFLDTGFGLGLILGRRLGVAQNQDMTGAHHFRRGELGGVLFIEGG